jgi:hypothetical protein
MCWKKEAHGFSGRLLYLQLHPDCPFAYGHAVPASGVQRKTKREASSCYESLTGQGVMGVAWKAKAKNFSQTSILSPQRLIPAYVQYSSDKVQRVYFAIQSI